MSSSEEENYISLREATKYCNYSQEYLSLRIRQGKLRGVKLGRNWVTKKQWLKEYIEGIENNTNTKKQQTLAREQVIPPQDISEVPDDLPMGQFSQALLNLYIQEKPRFVNLNFLILFLITSVILISAIYFEKETIGTGVYNFSIIAKEAIDEILGERGKVFVSELLTKADEISGNLTFIEKKIDKFKKGAKSLAESISIKINYLISFFKKEEREKKAERGMVVVSTQGKDIELLKEKIKKSFSDEVKVKPIDNDSGIIIPVFKAGEGEEYLYILVPTKTRQP